MSFDSLVRVTGVRFYRATEHSAVSNLGSWPGCLLMGR